MNDIVVQVNNLTKCYIIDHVRQRHDTLSEILVDGLRSPIKWLRSGQKEETDHRKEKIWALRNISFEVKKGDVVGIIGPNGSGKSTLLKILSRITKPDEGYAKICGRVGSLLEVGSGFHHELSGRENIYLNGAILGMKKREIDRKFEEIVDFSGVEKFIDTPVKRYSSGMKVRLAFAVAAHLEPEILLVDEVLAVGDAEFQNKCLGKMEEVSSEGRTVLFVSHNMGAIQTLCERGIFLRNGSILANSSATEAVSIYLRTLEQSAPMNLAERTDRQGKGEVRLIHVEIRDSDNRPQTTLIIGKPASFVFRLNTLLPRTSCTFALYNQSGQLITNFESAIQGSEDTFDSNVGPIFVCEIGELLLAPGRYRMNVAIQVSDEIQDHIEAAAIFNVEEGQVRGRLVKRHHRIVVRLPHRWIRPSLD
jgi:lipopolysaccharide transport system ATP-binding protein